MRMAESISARTLACLLGKMNSTACVISPAPPLVSKSTYGSLQHSGEPLTGLRRSSIPTTSQPGRAEMVGYRDVQMEWQNSSQEGDKHDHQLRCIPARLGSSLWGANHRANMVTSGGRIPHQLPRAVGSNPSCADICERQMQDIHSVDNRQHHSSGLHKSSGGYSLQRVGQPDKRSVDVVSREEHTHHSSTPTRSSEFHRRCGITVADRQDRLEAKSLYFSQDSEDFQPTGSGPLCNSPVCPVPTLLQLVARSICRSNKCVSPSVDPHQGVRQRTLEPGRQDTHPGADPTSH